jgi:hypothetical protein
LRRRVVSQCRGSPSAQGEHSRLGEMTPDPLVQDGSRFAGATSIDENFYGGAE